MAQIEVHNFINPPELVLEQVKMLSLAGLGYKQVNGPLLEQNNSCHLPLGALKSPY
jgi:hypothetical protein